MSVFKINLPDPTDSGTPEEFLKQLELCVHHARKSLTVLRENQDSEAPREDDFCEFKSDNLFAEIEKIEVTDLPMKQDKVQDMFWEHIQNIELSISVN